MFFLVVLIEESCVMKIYLPSLSKLSVVEAWVLLFRVGAHQIYSVPHSHHFDPLVWSLNLHQTAQMDKLKNTCKVKKKKGKIKRKKGMESKVALNPNHLNQMVQQPIALISQDFTFVFQENN